MSGGARRGRGAVSNQAGRFESIRHAAIDDGWDSADELPPLRTRVTVDRSRSIIARNSSPDVPFDQSVNPYRGCEHGCVYCFARPTHAYLGLSAGLDFESRLFVKPDAARLLRDALRRPGYRCRVLALGTNTDPYQPIERRYRVMRQILELLAECSHPVSITTKSGLVERDIDLLAEMARCNLAQVSVSLTTLDRDLARRLEPRAAAPHRRLETIRRLSEAGIPVNVSVAPIIPLLTDPELETVLDAAVSAGAGSASYILLRLPLEVRELFEEWLADHYPLKAGHVMSLIRQCRGGRENDSTFGRRKRGAGPVAQLIRQRFQRARRHAGLDAAPPELDAGRFAAPAAAGQLMLL
jgi:DNA repair photolyase